MAESAESRILGIAPKAETRFERFLLPEACYVVARLRRRAEHAQQKGQKEIRHKPLKGGAIVNALQAGLRAVWADVGNRHIDLAATFAKRSEVCSFVFSGVPTPMQSSRLYTLSSGWSVVIRTRRS